ncbi:hypothetical protein K413DRAFT_4803 [Clostridium sp. ASBs410]|jgi:hypothetical protein|nr:hypothetical protein K413DRAFT_4803 [Clostridium sp. ASBs410]
MYTRVLPSVYNIRSMLEKKKRIIDTNLPLDSRWFFINIKTRFN